MQATHRHTTNQRSAINARSEISAFSPLASWSLSNFEQEPSRNQSRLLRPQLTSLAGFKHVHPPGKQNSNKIVVLEMEQSSTVHFLPYSLTRQYSRKLLFVQTSPVSSLYRGKLHGFLFLVALISLLRSLHLNASG